MCIFKGDSLLGIGMQGAFAKAFRHIVAVRLLSHVWLFATPWTAVCQASLFFTISQSLLKLMSIDSVISSNHLILCWSLLLLPSVFPSIRVFSSESALRIKWLKYWSFSFSNSPFNEYSGLISFRIDLFETYERWLTTLFSLHLGMDLRLSLPWPFSLPSPWKTCSPSSPQDPKEPPCLFVNQLYWGITYIQWMASI